MLLLCIFIVILEVSCVNRYDQFYIWGLNDQDQCGAASPNPKRPAAVITNPPPIANYQILQSCSNSKNTWVVASNGELYGYGDATYIGSGGTGGPYATPELVSGGIAENIVGVKCIDDEVIAITSLGKLWGWGLNTEGLFGLGDKTAKPLPTNLMVGALASLSVVDYTMSTKNTIVATGSPGNYVFYAAGQGGSRLNGDGSNKNRLVWTATTSTLIGNPARGPLKRLQALTDDGVESVAFCLFENGQLYWWGQGTYSGLGANSPTDAASPTLYNPAGALPISDLSTLGLTIEDIACGQTACIILTTDGQLLSWGRTNNLQLARATGNYDVPMVMSVGSLSGRTITEIRAIAQETFFVIAENGADEEIHGWGDNSNYKLDLADATDRASPVRILGGISGLHSLILPYGKEGQTVSVILPNVCDDLYGERACNYPSQGECISSPTCTCLNEWSGTSCQTCTLAHPTPGTCDNSNCLNDWYGATCSSCNMVNPVPGTCDNTNCLNDWYGTTCQSCDVVNQRVPGSCIKSDCIYSWQGVNCDSCVVIIHPTPGTCQTNDCLNEWSGTNCDACTLVHPTPGTCDNSNCANLFTGSTCNTCVPIVHPNTNTCENSVCLNEWTGTICDTCTLVHPTPGTCDNSNCLDVWVGTDCNTCTAIIHPKAGTCKNNECLDEWYGATCNQCDMIHPQPGICDHNFCSDLWQGLTCNDCMLVAHPATGTCEAGNCLNEWSGDGCNDCLTVIHPVAGTCVLGNCADEWSANDCDTCATVTIAHPAPGTCEFSNCLNEWEGVDCNTCNLVHPTVGTCDNTNCLNQWEGLECNTCNLINPTPLTCDNTNCLDDWEGTSCGNCPLVNPIDVDTCQYFNCLNQWYGQLCDQCELVNPSPGECNNQTCLDDWYGILCEKCDVVYRANMGNCRESECDTGYEGVLCDQWKCPGTNKLDYYMSEVADTCFGNGDCVAPNDCTCFVEYLGFSHVYCNDAECNGVSASEIGTVCTGHGTCYFDEECTCDFGYGGGNCEYYTCNGIVETEDEICSSHGDCTGPDNCVCFPKKWTSTYCTIPMCNGKAANSSGACTGHGNCLNPNICECEQSWVGNYCQTSWFVKYWFVVASPPIAIAICIVICIVLFIVGILAIKKYKSYLYYKKLKELDMVEVELEVVIAEKNEEETPIPDGPVRVQDARSGDGGGPKALKGKTKKVKAKVDTTLYKLEFAQIKLKKQLKIYVGSFEVFHAMLSEHEVCLKKFQIKDFRSQNEIKRFESAIGVWEVRFDHPNLLSFLGCYLNRNFKNQVTEIGVVFDYCKDGKLDDYLKIKNKQVGIITPIEERIRVCTGILDGLKHLVSEDIIKNMGEFRTSDVLVAEDNVAKISNFGFNRKLKEIRDRDGRCGSRLKGNYFQAPEITLGKVSIGQCNEKCVVFSFSFIMFEIMEEKERCLNFDQKSKESIAHDVAVDSNIRPFPEFPPKYPNWILDVMKSCWNVKPQERPSLFEISEIFEKNEKDLDYMNMSEISMKTD